MRRLIALAALALVCGCMMPGGQTETRYVCREGQVVSDPKDCIEPTTTTVSYTTTTTTTTTTTPSTTTSSTATSSTSTTTTTICDDSVRGYLQVNDIDERCYRGYRFRIDPGVWDCTTTGLACKIGFVVTKPDGKVENTFTRATGTGGLGFQVDGMDVELACINTDKSQGFPAYAGLLKFA